MNVNYPKSTDASDRNSPFMVKGIPVVPRRVLQKFASGLRDTGSDTAIARHCLVDDDCFTGKRRRFLLLDGSIKEPPEGKIQVQTPIFAEGITDVCMAHQIYHLVRGNIPGVRETHYPDLYWEYEGAGEREMGTSSTSQTKPLQLQSLISAVASTEALQDTRLKTPLFLHANVNRLKLAREQREDNTFRSLYRKEVVSLCKRPPICFL
ncbi:hypothetical protein HPB48_023192 [Haemaphysalis longicornis]|uniref:Uncharacterized protein n=1 Tax=Haemaphysalis longicornis TaxID=44386 RepID=A0A9J6H6Z2_HAELO|nr:hypothetical protein HPB48_023192 [Haemaphysalis longicornis]